MPLARPAGFALALGGVRAPVRPRASLPASVLLPFPPPLAGVSAERRRQGADPVEGEAEGEKS